MAVGLDQDPAGYAEISDVSAQPLGDFTCSVDDCKQRCNQMAKCQGIKFTHGAELSKGACVLLGGRIEEQMEGSKVQDKIQKIQEQEKRQVEEIEKKTEQAKQTQHAVAEMEKENIANPALHAAIQPPSPNKMETITRTQLLANIVDTAEQEEAEAEAEMEKLKKEEAIKPIPGPQLVEQVLAIQKKITACKRAEKLRAKYKTRVKQEVERDEAKESTNLEDTMYKEVDRANRIVTRRAKRQARADMRLEGPKLERKVMAMLGKTGGQKMAQKFLADLKTKVCKEMPELKLADIPTPEKVDSWPNCAEMKNQCAQSTEIQRNCAATCQ